MSKIAFFARIVTFSIEAKFSTELLTPEGTKLNSPEKNQCIMIASKLNCNVGGKNVRGAPTSRWASTQ